MRCRTPAVRVVHHLIVTRYFLCCQQVTPPMDPKWIEFIHFGLTSQDINNTSIPLSLKDAVQKSFLPSITKVPSFLRCDCTALTPVSAGFRVVHGISDPTILSGRLAHGSMVDGRRLWLGEYQHSCPTYRVSVQHGPHAFVRAWISKGAPATGMPRVAHFLNANSGG